MINYKSVTVKSIANYLELPYEGKNLTVSGTSSINNLQNGTVSFSNSLIIKSNAKALIICRQKTVVNSNSISIIRVPNPRYIFALITSECLLSRKKNLIHESAIIHPSVEVGNNLSIGPYSVVESNSKIGDNCEIGSHVLIKAGTIIGNDTVVKSGAIIGEQGFGFGFSEDKEPKRIIHTGGVIIGNKVEIGANCVVCSGTITPTIIKDYVKIDDLVFIAHNCEIGRKTMVVASSVICGSVRIGEKCWIGPNSSIIDVTNIGNNSVVGIGTVVTENVLENKKMMGFNGLTLKNLIKLKKRISFGK
jgi:UDP-3-O-[3-hydroxymyristoyl] glucosamine N-acyltransferase LpxD